jgi:hypothetical protein
MGEGQCWSVQGDGSRCVGPTQPGALFCSRHRHVQAADASRVWRAPEAEMPRELVATLRRANPAIAFPAPQPEPLHAGAVTGPVASVASPLREATSVETAAPEGPSGSPELDWLLALLRTAMEGVMAGEATPLQKANAVSRLAGQYLKAFGAKEREQENKALRRHLAAAEARVAALEAFVAAERPSATPASGGAVSPAGSREQEPEREERPVTMRLPDEGWVALRGGGRAAPRSAEREALSLAGAVVESSPPD